MRMLIAVTLATGLYSAPLQAQDFTNRTISLVVGFAPGGGTDVVARKIASFYPKYLPGSPSIVVRNVPGGGGVIAANFFVQQVKPDGLTILVGSSTTADPQFYRQPQAVFDPSQFGIIGGVGMGGSAMVISREAEARLMDKSAPPAVIGVTGGLPRSGMQAAAWGIEFLGWNARWVLGYRGTNDLIYALERGEVAMTSTGNMYHVERLLGSGRFRILTQTGSYTNEQFGPRPEFGDAGLITEMLRGKIKEEVASQAFTYWSTLTALDKWLALPPGAATEIRDVYRAGFNKLVVDPEFVEQSKSVSEAFEPMSASDIEKLVITLRNTPPQAITYIGSMLRRQGLTVD